MRASDFPVFGLFILTPLGVVAYNSHRHMERYVIKWCHTGELHHCCKTLKNLKEKRVIWLTDSEVSVASVLVTWCICFRPMTRHTGEDIAEERWSCCWQLECKEGRSRVSYLLQGHTYNNLTSFHQDPHLNSSWPPKSTISWVPSCNTCAFGKYLRCKP